MDQTQEKIIPSPTLAVGEKPKGGVHESRKVPDTLYTQERILREGPQLERITTMLALPEERIPELARLRTEQWGDVLVPEYQNNETAALSASLDNLISRRNIAGGLQLILMKGDKICGAIHPLIVQTNSPEFTDDVYTSHSFLTGAGFYTSHNPFGNTIVCPEVYSAKENRGGIKRGGSLLVFEALSRGQQIPGIEHMIVYTRPFVAEFVQRAIAKGRSERDGLEEYLVQRFRERDEGKRYADPLGMHLSLGAKLIRFVPGARPSDQKTAGYCAILEYPMDRKYDAAQLFAA